MKPLPIPFLCGFLLILPFAGFTQPAIEFASGTGPAGNGSAIANQVVTFQENALNPITGTYIPFSPTVTATFAISNQQYVLPATQNPSGADVSFGANVNPAGKTPSAATIYPAMNYVSAAPATDFSSTQDNVGAGMSMADNYAIELFTSAMGLYNANSPTNGTYYMADLTITFSAPITDPVIHIVGLGGTSGALGLTTQLTLTTAGLTMTELSGSPEFSVTGGGTQIVNTAATPTATTGSGAASGSVLINGNIVTTLTFQLYLRGDGRTPTWSTANEHVGDAWLIGVSGLNTLCRPSDWHDVFYCPAPTTHRGSAMDNSDRTEFKIFHGRTQPGRANWSSIGQVTAAGNSQDLLPYNYVDRLPLTGANYYRLQEVADDGSTAYSPIRNVNFTGAAVAIGWYPNPTHDRLTLRSNSNLQSITLTTLDGHILQSFDGFASGQTVDLSRYPFGIYFLIIRTSDGQSQTAKIERN